MKKTNLQSNRVNGSSSWAYQETWQFKYIYDEPCHRAYMPVFTLTDLVSLLPKTIEAEILNVRRIVKLEVRWCDDCWLVRYSALCGDIVYDKTRPSLAYELVDALYEFIIWCIDNKYIKL